MAGACGVVFLGERGAEQRHQPIARELVHHPLEAVDPLAQDRQAAIHHPPPVLRVEPLGQLHRPDHVREQHRHQLALPLQRAARRQHPLGQPVRRIGAPIARRRTTGAAGRCGCALHPRPPRARRPGRPHPANSAARSARPSVVREARLDTASAPGAVASAYRIPGTASLNLCSIAPARTRAMVRGGANHDHPPGLSTGCPVNAPPPSDTAKAPEIPVIRPPRGPRPWPFRTSSGRLRTSFRSAQRVPAHADGAHQADGNAALDLDNGPRATVDRAAPRLPRRRLGAHPRSAGLRRERERRRSRSRAHGRLPFVLSGRA
jgi:hypothetical protein